jgi:hypothetical protein
MISKKGIRNGGVSEDPEKKILQQVMSVIGKGSGAYLFGAPPTDSENNPVLFEADSAQGTCDLSAIVQALAFARYQDAVEDAAVLLCGATAKLAGRSLNKCNAGLHFIIRKQSKNSKKAKTAGASAVGSLIDKESYDPILSQNNPRASQISKEVKLALEEAGHIFEGHSYSIPDVRSVSSMENYLEYLCRHGIPVVKGNNQHNLLSTNLFQHAKAWVNFQWIDLYLKHNNQSLQMSLLSPLYHCCCM